MYTIPKYIEKIKKNITKNVQERKKNKKIYKINSKNKKTFLFHKNKNCLKHFYR